MNEIKERIRYFIKENLIAFDDEAEFSDFDNLFEMGFVSSLFALKLLVFVEQEFAIVITDDEMVISNFSSVDNIASLVEKKKN
jgi:methoxymalonate biosynthesis acyl carrier protein